jgi:hypothetical protein
MPIIWDALDRQLKATPWRMELIVGDASGADEMALLWARDRAVDVELHRADWKKHGKAAGPIRNQQMVDAGADVVLAFPFGESRGTRHCMKAANAAGILVVEHTTTGEVQ